MVKTIKEAVNEVVEGKKQNLTLKLQKEEFDNETNAWKDNIITFEDIAGYQLSAEWVAVMEKDGTTNAFPKSEIKYVKHFSV